MFIVASALCVLSYFMKKRGVRPLKKRPYVIFLVIAVVLAVAVRVAAFGSVPGGVNQDGAMAAVDAKALADYGTDRLGMVRPVHFTAWGFGQMSVLMSYCMVPFIKLFGLSVVTMRLPILLASLLGLAFLYLFCKDVFNRDLALIVLFFAAINPWHIVQSRWALDCNMFPHVLIAALYFLNHGICGKGKKWNIYISMPLFALSMYCYGISIYTVPLFLFFACLCLIAARKINVKEALICAALYLLVAWPFIAMIFINTFDLKPIESSLFTVPYFAETIRKGDILFFSEDFFPQLWQNILSLLRVLFQVGDDYLCNVVPGFSTMYVFSVPFIIVGNIWLLGNWRRNTGYFLLLLLFITGIFSGLVTNNVNVNRINIIFYPLIVMAGIGIFRVFRNVKFSDMAVQAMFAAGFALFCCLYFTSYAKDISSLFMEDFGRAVSSVKPDEAEEIFITPDSQDVNRWYVSEVLTLFYHDVDAEFYQSSAFNETYHCITANPAVIHDYPDAAYVIRADIADLFPDEYEIREYGRFATAIKKASGS